MQQQPLVTKKVVIIGDSGVGKTSLMNRYLFNKFDDEQMPSMGGQSKPHLVTVPNEGQIKLTIWDTAGQEKFRSLTRMYFQDAEAAIIVYDTTFRQSFDGARKWLEELRANANIQDPIVALVGNKSDLASSMQVSFEEAHNMQSETKLDIVKETSAKAEDNNNVQELFVDIARRLLKKHKSKLASEGGGSSEQLPTSGVKIGSSQSSNQSGGKKKKGCC